MCHLDVKYNRKSNKTNKFRQFSVIYISNMYEFDIVDR